MTARGGLDSDHPTSIGDPRGIGLEMHRLIGELYPICRSITGDGVRQSLRLIEQHIPLTMREVPTGTHVFDWTVPKEWNIRDAYIKDPRGKRVIDFRESNLHVVGYSVPVKATLPAAELKERLFSVPESPGAVPYRTAYYQETWGFCVRHTQLAQLTDDEYEVCIDSSLEPGSLTFGEYCLPGETADEVLLSSHICHPSMANDNLSGIVLLTFLAKRLASAPRRYTYRFLFIPGTIGAITWLALNESRVPAIKHGLVVACVGDRGPFTYKRSRRGDAEIDRAAAHVLRHDAGAHQVLDFSPYGYDERQFCSPGFDLPVGCFMRSPHGRFPEYHTSADDLTLVQPESLAESLRTCLTVLEVLEHNRRYVNQHPKCEPQLGRRGVYRSIGGPEVEARELALLWVLNLADGHHDLLDIAERSRLQFRSVKNAAEVLVQHGLLREAT